MRSSIPHHLALTLSILVSNALSVQAQDQRCTSFGVTAAERMSDLRATIDGGFTMGGWPYGGDLSFVDMEILKLNALGDLQWGKVLQGGGVEYGKCVVPTSDGGVVLAGYTASFGQGGYDAVAVKFSGSGDVLWTTTIGTSENEAFLGGAELSDGRIALAGRAYNASGLQDGFVALMSANGSVTWSKRVHGTASDGIELHGVCEAPDNGLLVCGLKSSVQNGGVAILLDESGDVEWGSQVRYGYLHDALALGDDGFAFAGMVNNGPSGTFTDMCIARADTAGELVWGAMLPYNGQHEAYQVAQRPNGGFILAGDHDIATNNVRMLLAAFDADGELEWNRTIGTAASATAGIVAKADEGFALAGNSGGQAIMALLDSDGMPCPSCGVDSLELTPTAIEWLPYTVTTLTSGVAGTGAWTATAISNSTAVTCSSVGVLEAQHMETVRLSPNPAADELFVQVPSDWLSASGTIELLDAQGRTRWTARIGSGATRVKLDALADGLYGCRVCTHDQLCSTLPVVIAR